MRSDTERELACAREGGRERERERERERRTQARTLASTHKHTGTLSQKYCPCVKRDLVQR